MFLPYVCLMYKIIVLIDQQFRIRNPLALKTVEFPLLFLSYKAEWPGDLGNKGSSSDLPTKFCISLGKSLHFSDFLFSFFIYLMQFIQAIFPFNSTCFRPHNTGVHTSVHSIPFHLESVTNLLFNLAHLHCTSLHLALQ